MKRRASQPTYAKTQAELATMLGVTRETIGRWLKIPGNPGRRADGRMEVRAWTAWAEKNRDRYLGPSTRALKDELMRQQLLTLQHRLKVSQRMHISIEEVERLYAELERLITLEVRKLHRLAAELENQPVSVVDRMLRAFEVGLLTQLHEGAAEIP